MQDLLECFAHGFVNIKPDGFIELIVCHSKGSFSGLSTLERLAFLDEPR